MKRPYKVHKAITSGDQVRIERFARRGGLASGKMRREAAVRTDLLEAVRTEEKMRAEERVRRTCTELVVARNEDILTPDGEDLL